jgi:hypothetical protein
MATFGNLIDEVQIKLAGYTQRQDQASHLTASITSTALTFTVSDPTILSRGLVEVDDELMWIASYDRTTGVATIAPYGRGYRGTTAASHATGARVSVAPTFPRALIAEAINDAIEATYPDLFAVASTSFTFVASRSTYALPAGTIEVQDASWQSVGASLEWVPLRRYRVDANANTTAWPTGATISIHDGILPGRTVEVTYTKPAQALEYSTDDFTDTGLPASAKEVIILGASYRMASYLDVGRTPAQSVEADALQQTNPIGTGGQVSRILYQLYAQRLAVEVRRQQEQHQARIRYTN